MHAAPQGTDSRARALALDEASPRHLHRLAHVLVTEPAPIGNALDHGRVAFVQKSPSPACLIEPTSDPVAWSGAYARLSGGPERPSAECRYALVMMLTNHRPQEIMVSWKRQKHTICAF